MTDITNYFQIPEEECTHDTSVIAQSSVETLLGFLSLYREQPSAILWTILYEQSDITANRIIYHAQFALDHLSVPVTVEATNDEVAARKLVFNPRISL